MWLLNMSVANLIRIWPIHYIYKSNLCEVIDGVSKLSYFDQFLINKDIKTHCIP